jgi:AraC family transcriptional regulator
MQSYQERILRVLIYIQNHLDEALSLEALASIAHFSEYHFHRIFTAYTGESIKSYVRRLRLARATSDLVFTDLPLVQVAERAGYDTQQSFHRAFKEAFNKTPKEFRDEKSEAITSVARAEQGELKPIPVVIKTLQAIPVAFVRHVGSYEQIQTAWHQLIQQIDAQHFFSEKTLKIGIPYDSSDITPEDKLRYDACVSLDGLDFRPKGLVGVQALHAGKYAVITHVGSLDNIDKTYQYLFGVWLPQSGYEPDDYPNFMIHRKLPFQTAPEALVTEICLPIK